MLLKSETLLAYYLLSGGQNMINRRRKPVVILQTNTHLPVGQHYYLITRRYGILMVLL